MKTTTTTTKKNKNPQHLEVNLIVTDVVSIKLDWITFVDTFMGYWVAFDAPAEEK